MLTLLSRLLIIIAALWLVRAVVAVLFGGAHTHRRSSSRNAQETGTKRMVKDPVCGMYMDPRLAIHVENSKGSFYFCSEQCRRKFLAEP